MLFNVEVNGTPGRFDLESAIYLATQLGGEITYYFQDSEDFKTQIENCSLIDDPILIEWETLHKQNSNLSELEHIYIRLLRISAMNQELMPAVNLLAEHPLLRLAVINVSTLSDYKAKLLSNHIKRLSRIPATWTLTVY